MNLIEGMKLALSHRQSPMTAPQLAYFLCANKIIPQDDLEKLAREIDETALAHLVHFSVYEYFIFLSPWDREQKATIQYVVDIMTKVQQALEQGGRAQCLTLGLSLLLYKRLSDLTYHQLTGPVVPDPLKFNAIVQGTDPADLPSRLLEVMYYIENTNPYLTDVFLVGKEDLWLINSAPNFAKLHQALWLLLPLNLEEEQVPTPVFQAIFSRLFLRDIKTKTGLKWNE